MRRAILVLALGFALTAALCPAAPTAQESLIYGGNLKSAPAPLVVGAWGSGSLQEVGELALVGGSSLKLVSQGDFRGGRIEFPSPLDISAYAGQRAAYLELWVRPYFGRPEAPAAQAVPGAPGTAPGAAPAPVVPRFSGGGRGQEEEEIAPSPIRTPPAVPGASTSPALTPRASSVRPGSAYTRPGTSSTTRRYPRPGARTLTGGATGAPAYPAVAPELTPPAPTGPANADRAAFRATAFSVHLVTDEGTAMLPGYPIHPGTKNPAGWVRLGFPLHEFDGPIGDKLQRILVFSDRADTLYVGEIRLQLDVAAVEARPIASPAIARVGQPITFIANASAGLSPLDISWDFDDSDGIERQAEGPRVMNAYDRPGPYYVIATIRDATGANPQARSYILLVQVK
jgi:hypothetical protein